MNSNQLHGMQSSRRSDSVTHISRTQLHHENHNNHLITLILVSIIILIAAFALVYGIADDSWDHSNPRTRVTRVHHKKMGHHHSNSNRKSDQLIDRDNNEDHPRVNQSQSPVRIKSSPHVSNNISQKNHASNPDNGNGNPVQSSNKPNQSMKNN